MLMERIARSDMGQAERSRHNPHDPHNSIAAVAAMPRVAYDGTSPDALNSRHTKAT
jgi:hypothetical protein